MSALLELRVKLAMAHRVVADYKTRMRYPPLALVLALIPSIALASPDLCDDVWLDANGSPIVDSTGMQLARFCKATNELAVTAWSDDVCCTIGTSASCTPTDAHGRCLSGAKFWCDYAVLTEVGVVCQQPWPDACVEGFCSIAPPGSTPEDTEPLCCLAEDQCSVVDLNAPMTCAGDWVHCEAPFTGEDGWVGCSDDE